MTCNDERELKLRKLVTKDWVHVSPGLVLECEGRGGGHSKCIFFFGGLLFGGSNAEKWGDHQNKTFFLNNSVKALIPFKKEHQFLLKLHVPLEGEV